MFEKDAEEYGLQQALWCTSESGDLKDAFRDGAEFGYNKAKEELVKAKEIITNLVKFDASYIDDEECQRKNELYDKIWEEAEQFLKEADK